MKVAVRLTVVSLAAALAGCAALPFPDTSAKAGEDSLIAYAASLTRMDGEQRRQALAAAQQRWRQTANPRDRARLGLTYGQWDYGGYDADAAARNLHGALAVASQEWRQGEREFLETRAAQLAYLAKRESELTDLRRRIERLREDLAEAERKLHAITAIERNLDERNGRR